MNLRFKATGLHLFVSAFIAVVVAAGMLLVWFPDGYAKAMGAHGLLVLVLGCDAVVGPLLSFIICDPRKSRRTLMLDYLVIAALQLAALGYGVSVIMQSRPVFTVFSKDRFNLVAAFEVDPEDLRVAPANFSRLSWNGPQLVTLRLPGDTAGRNHALDLELSGKHLQAMPAYYVPHDPAEVLSAAKPMEVLLKARPSAADVMHAALARRGLTSAEVVWLPVETRFGFMTALVDQSSGSILEFIDIDVF